MPNSNADGKIQIKTFLDTKGVDKGLDNIGKSLSKIGKLVGITFGTAAIVNFTKQCVELYNVQEKAQKQLAVSLKNMDATENAYDKIIAKASELQSKGFYGDEGFIGAGAEFATYMSDADAIGKMMDTLADYATGMSGGVELTYDSMVQYATNLGKIMTGSFDAMTKKGFEFTEVQKRILKGEATESDLVEELGDGWKEMSDDMRKASVISNVIEANWSGMYEAMSDTPEGKLRQLANTIGDIKERFGQGVTVIYNLFLPALQKITAFADLCSKVFVKLADAIAIAFGGKTSSQLADVKSAVAGIGTGAGDTADEVAGAAKKMKSSFSGLDELNTLGQQDSGSGAGAGVSAGIGGAGGFELVTDEQLDQDNKFVGIIEKIKENFDALKTAVEPFIDRVESALSWIYENVLKPIGVWLIEDVSPAAIDIISGAVETLGAVCDKAKPILEWLWENFLKPAAEWVGDKIVDGLQWVADKLHAIAENDTAVTILTSVALAIGLVTAAIGLAKVAMVVASAAGTVFGGVLAFITSPITWIVAAIAALIAIGILLYENWDTIKETASKVWDGVCAVFKAGVESVKGWWTNLTNTIKEKWEDLKQKLSEGFEKIKSWFKDAKENISRIWTDLKTKIVNTWGEMKDKVVQKWNDMKDKIVNTMENMKTKFNNFKSTITNGFTNIKTSISNVLSNIKTNMTNTWNSITTGIKGFVNKIIGFINSMIGGVESGVNSMVRAINNISFDIPDWLGGGTVGFNLSTVSMKRIPYLAQGAVIPANKPFMAMLGDQRNGTNIEAPLDTIKQALIEALSESGGTNVNVYLEGDAKGVFNVVRTESQRYFDRTGNGAFAF